jgi:hypothetical protein
MGLLTTLTLACLLTPAALAGTWTVGLPATGADFVSIQAAIDAAAEGDLILVEQGSYQEQLRIDAKGLTIQGLGNVNLVGPAATLTSQPLLHVENLTPGQEVHLRDLSILRITGVWGDAIRLERNRGSVWIEQAFVDTYDGHALRVVDCDDVLLSEVTLQANSAFQDPLGSNQPSHGLLLEDGSSVQAFQLDAIGSHAPPLFVTLTAPVEGGDAAHVIDSRLCLVAPQLQGGTGGSIFQAGCATGSRGGSALEVVARSGATPEVELLGGKLLPGQAGSFTPGCASDPGSSATIQAPAGTVIQLSGQPRLLSMPTTPYPNGSFEFQLQGAPGDLFFLFASPTTTPALPLAGIEGDLFLSPLGSFVAATGQIGPSGFAVQGAGFSNPGPPLTVRTQAVLADTAGALWLSGPGTILFP